MLSSPKIRTLIVLRCTLHINIKQHVFLCITKLFLSPKLSKACTATDSGSVPMACVSREETNLHFGVICVGELLY